MVFNIFQVLKTTNYVDVQQNNAYGDIAVRKLKKFDQTFGVDSMLNWHKYMSGNLEIASW